MNQNQGIYKLKEDVDRLLDEEKASLISSMNELAKIMQDAPLPSDVGQLISPIGDEIEETPLRKVSPIEYPKGFKSLLEPGEKVLVKGEVLELYQVKKLRKNNTSPRYWFKGIGILAIKEKWEE